MNSLSRSHKILLLIATFMPVVFMFLFFAIFIGTMILAPTMFGGTNAEPPVGFFILIFGFQFLYVIWKAGLFVAYVVHLLQTDRVKQEQKVLWGVLLFLGGIIAMAVYWFMYVWPEPETPAEPTQTMA